MRLAFAALGFRRPACSPSQSSSKLTFGATAGEGGGRGGVRSRRPLGGWWPSSRKLNKTEN